MPEKRIKYGGTEHVFPDGFTDADISKALQVWDTQQAKAPPDFGNVQSGSSTTAPSAPSQFPAGSLGYTRDQILAGKAPGNVKLEAPKRLPAVGAYDTSTSLVGRVGQELRDRVYGALSPLSLYGAEGVQAPPLITGTVRALLNAPAASEVAPGNLPGALGTPQWEPQTPEEHADVQQRSKDFFRTLGGPATLAYDTGYSIPVTLDPNATSDEKQEAAETQGAAIGALAAPKVITSAAKSAPVKLIGETINRRGEAVASNLAKRAATNTEKALNPRGLEHQAAAQRIAPELAASQKLKGITQKGIDNSVVAELERSGNAVRAAEDRFVRDPRPEAQLSRDAILGYIDESLAKLKVKKTDVMVRTKAEAALQDVRAKIAEMPQFMDPDTAISLRRNLDAAVDEMGGFRDAPPDMRMAVTAHRGVSDFVRRSINDYDPALSKANHEYWLSRKAADIVDRRQLGEVGKAGSGLPGRGSLLDDILAAWAGMALGGPVGAVAAETANLVRQTPGYALQKAKTQQYIADAFRRGTPAPYTAHARAKELVRPKGPQRKLLESGPPVVPPQPTSMDPSGITVDAPVAPGVPDPYGIDTLSKAKAAVGKGGMGFNPVTGLPDLPDPVPVKDPLTGATIQRPLQQVLEEVARLKKPDGGTFTMKDVQDYVRKLMK